MYVETMTTEEKLKEFKRAFSKIKEVSDRVLERYLEKNKIRNDDEIDLGIRKLIVDNTVYYYHLAAIRNSNLFQTRRIINLSCSNNMYTIQTHKNSHNQYIIMFVPSNNFTRCSSSIVEIEIHLISRYRERFLKDQTLSFEYSLQEYIKGNFLGACCDINENEVARITRDGIALGIRVDKYTIKLKTFITEEQLKEDQMLWSKYGSLWRDHEESVKFGRDHPIDDYRGF